MVEARKKTAKDLNTECSNLEQLWDDRQAKMKRWYELLKQKDEFSQDGMESFVTNEPRTFFNLALHMLIEDVPHRIPVDAIDPADQRDANMWEALVSEAWRRVDKRYRRSGRKSFLRQLVSLILATGWYSVFSYVDDTGFYAEVWNPYQVFPEWDEERLVKVVRRYTLGKEAAKRKITANKEKGWAYNKLITGDVKVDNYWYLDDNGEVTNTVMFDGEFAKPPEVDSDYDAIPVWVSPVGGLPDNGSMDTKWRESVGESALATNEVMYKQYNKQWTFVTQLLRDTAQPRWFERSAEGQILRPQDMFKRGAIFRGGINDSVEALQVPPLPIELRTDRFDIQNMIQRGSLPWALYGNLQQQIAGYLMSQIASAAQQILQSFKEAVVDVCSDIDNFWVMQVADHNYNPFEMQIPAYKDTFTFDCDYQLKIPGDLVQRATVGRMLSPNLEFDVTTTIDLLFPEITNPVRMRSEARKDRALNSEVAIKIDTIAAFKKQSERLREAGESYHAELYDQAAETLRNQMIPQQQGGVGQPGGGRQITPMNQAGGQPRPEQQILNELM